MRKAVCRWCGSEKTVKRGKTPTQNRGLQQRYLCKDCRKTFVPDTGFWKMKTKPSVVTMSVDMYLSNLSSRKMRNQLRRHMGTRRSHVSVLNWVRKYVQRVGRFTETLKPSLGGRFYADETDVKCQNRNDVFWCCIDWPTRFVNVSMYADRDQNQTDAVEFLRKVRASKEDALFLQTDGLPLYPWAFHRVFTPKCSNNKSRTEHRVNNVSRTKRHNVRIETLFMKIKDRVQDMRGFKSARSAAIIMAGLVIQHNFIETHSAGFVPCDRVGIGLSLGADRWMGLIGCSF